MARWSETKQRGAWAGGHQQRGGLGFPPFGLWPVLGLVLACCLSCVDAFLVGGGAAATRHGPSLRAGVFSPPRL
jgi:hypothetical protein